MIQILGLRTYFNDRTQREEVAERFFDKKWRCPNIRELFKTLPQILDNIPDGEKYNLFYTVSECLEQKGRKFVLQEVIPIDLDGIDTTRLDDYVHIVSSVVGIDRSKLGIIATGNGLHILIGLNVPINEEEYFDNNRRLYKVLCNRIDKKIKEAGLSGYSDPVVFSAARLLRLPGTLNRKKNREEKVCTLINGDIALTNFDLSNFLGFQEAEYGSYVSPLILDNLPPADPKAVQETCGFLKMCKENQAGISEPQWYAMLSIIGRLPDGQKLAHEYSREHPNYNEYEAQLKLEHALSAAGPRTCENISTLWDGCPSCPHWKRCTSPIQLTGPDYIKTQATGFHNIIRDESGIEKKRLPNYDDLMKYFHQTHPFITMEEGGIVYTWNGTHWKDCSIYYIDKFAEDNFDPKPNNYMCMEFRGKIKRNNIRPFNWFRIHELINFKNGVLNLSTLEMSNHSIVNGFRYVLPFDYDPKAECPTFDKYLHDVTLGDPALQEVLLEYMGYCLSNVDPALGEKALILVGDGSNGKSVFIDLLKYMAGEGNYSTLSMGYELNKLENRYQLEGKLFNVSEETPDKAMLDNTVFKAIVTGGEVQARKLYHDSFSMRNTAKIIMACNDLPKTNDASYGMFRRLLIVPFQATFKNDGKDIYMRQKLYSEASGIYNRVLNALLRFKRNKKFTDSVVIANAVEGYRRENNPVQIWAEENLIKIESACTPLQDIYDSYVAYMMRFNHRHIIDYRVFGKEIKRCLNVEADRDRVNGRQQRVIRGWGLVVSQDF